MRGPRVNQAAGRTGGSARGGWATWIADKTAVSAPIIGATKSHHVDNAVAALDLSLTQSEIDRLEAAYTPRTGF
ncbi:aldo/keto reductase [Streptomyces sp. NPDC093065]|uniref:aldo/keto reductase n=1 Tax=Streptomyces sp. NPDC093065 TaxID=3366021 RepID=UPI00382B3D1A